MTGPRVPALHVTRAWRMEPVELPWPVPADGEVSVRLLFATVCGSDVPKFTGTWARFTPPLVPGAPIHECVGVVEQSRVPGIAEGEPVLAIPKHDAGLAEVYLASAAQTTRLPGWSEDDLPYATLGQPTAAVLHGLDRLGDVRGARVAIIGLGGIGLIAAILLRGRGVAQLAVIEPNEYRRTLGAFLVNAQGYPAWSTELAGQADVVVEAVGHDTYGDTLPVCLRTVRPGGRVLLLGNPADTSHAVGVETIVRRNLCLVGSISPQWETYLSAGARAVHDDLATFRRLITGHARWRDAERVFREHADPASSRLKVVLTG
ncbi:2-deoxy-scyllo-inosamine dehydrogenase [Streptomyces sp. Ag109_O5-1]|uniref:zinc-binding dehydrogenase n=1 Tax=Streptomyces sp. Ag109_O5-1 TaxID=1938851 RepID=UPI000F50601B|nr:zinc-binding dehydrogenase [Streptomyces sp. Ag109_O5-1]RPE38597.1 2-deoxy-scyllo-inosamine dehydrogenase [Streptomyces sp. Ag109_O5-1]